MYNASEEVTMDPMEKLQSNVSRMSTVSSKISTKQRVQLTKVWVGNVLARTLVNVELANSLSKK